MQTLSSALFSGVSTMASEETEDRTMMLTLLIGGGFLAFCVLGIAVGGGLLYANTQESSNGSAKPSVTVGALTNGGSIDTSALTGAAGNNYKPTSSYVEEGADSDVMVMGFNEGDGGTNGKATTLSDNAVQNTINNHQNDLIQCYAEGLEDNPDIQGRVDFHFRIAGDGHVAMVKVTRSGLEDKATEDCFVRSARGWKFPSTGGEAMTKFDTNFNFVFE
jgi:hypothetical protein